MRLKIGEMAKTGALEAEKSKKLALEAVWGRFRPKNGLEMA